MLAIGLMSGTSMDGIDAALLKTDGTPECVELLGHFFLPYDLAYSEFLKAAEYTIAKHFGNLQAATESFTICFDEYLKEVLKLPSNVSIDKKKSLDIYAQQHFKAGFASLDSIVHHSTMLHAQVVRALLKKYGYSESDISVIGYHGQTVYHHPEKKVSCSLGNGQWLARECGITVINNFRQQDIEMGGQGAPFAPLYHQALAVRDRCFPVVVVNCGGIANVTYIPNANPLDLVAFDTGPGNGLIDRFVRMQTGGAESMDKDGRYGSQGRVVASVLQALKNRAVIQNNQNYFSLSPPKSLDINELQLIPELDSLSLTDGCATLEAFTAQTIVESVYNEKALASTSWILAGGGWNNPVIYRLLKSHIQEKYGDVDVRTAEECGWHNASLEAQIFAYLSVRALRKDFLSVPGTTGVAHPVTGGSIFYP